MFNPDTRKFENLMNSSLVSQTAAIAAMAAANSLNVAASFNEQSLDQSSEWYARMRWDCLKNLFDAAIPPPISTSSSSNENFMHHWNLADYDDDDEDLMQQQLYSWN